MRRLVVDTANLLWRVAAAHGKYNNQGTPEEQAGLAMHMALNTLNKFYKQIKPDQVAVTFEGHKNWRKDYTKSSNCISGKIYKANRVKDDSMIPIFELMTAFEDLVRNHTSLVCLSHPLLEGDDLFAGYVQRFTSEGDEVVGLSGDKDFVQLLKHERFTLINPDKGKPRKVEEVCGVDDPMFFMFEKAFRGDSNDNVFPAYPRVQKKRLLRCMNDEYELVKIMNEKWTYTDDETGVSREFSVGDLFEENNLLMNLECQPEHIKEVICSSIDEALQNRKAFSFFHFTKFCGKYGLKQIAENSQQFANLFSQAKEKTLEKSENKRKTLDILEF